MSSTLIETLPALISTAEFQAISLAGLCCLGAWVLLSWFVKVVVSVLWPLFLFAGLMIIMPEWRNIIASDMMPKNYEILRNFSQRVSSIYNLTSIRNYE